MYILYCGDNFIGICLSAFFVGGACESVVVVVVVVGSFEDAVACFAISFRS